MRTGVPALQSGTLSSVSTVWTMCRIVKMSVGVELLLVLVIIKLFIFLYSWNLHFVDMSFGLGRGRAILFDITNFILYSLQIKLS